MVALADGMMVRVVLDVPKGASGPHMLGAYLEVFGERVEPQNVISGRHNKELLALIMPAFGPALDLP